MAAVGRQQRVVGAARGACGRRRGARVWHAAGMSERRRGRREGSEPSWTGRSGRRRQASPSQSSTGGAGRGEREWAERGVHSTARTHVSSPEATIVARYGGFSRLSVIPFSQFSISRVPYIANQREFMYAHVCARIRVRRTVYEEGVEQGDPHLIVGTRQRHAGRVGRAVEELVENVRPGQHCEHVDNHTRTRVRRPAPVGVGGAGTWQWVGPVGKSRRGGRENPE